MVGTISCRAINDRMTAFPVENHTFLGLINLSTDRSRCKHDNALRPLDQLVLLTGLSLTAEDLTVTLQSGQLTPAVVDVHSK